MSPGAHPPDARRLDDLPAARLAGIRQQHDALRLLVCEPDPAVSAALHRDITTLHVSATECRDGARALFEAGRGCPDALLLAADLPVVTAAVVVRALTDAGADLLIAVGHGAGQEDLVAEAVAAGAGRVLARPYSRDELRDLCLSLRGRAELDNPVLRAGALTVYPLAYEVVLDGRRIPMPVRELEVLVYLIRHRDRIVSVAELQGELWAGDGLAPRSNAVAATVMRLRSKLSDVTRPDVIRTVRGQGYRFYAPPAGLSGPAAGAATAAGQTTRWATT